MSNLRALLANSGHEVDQGNIGTQQANDGYDNFKIDTHDQPPFDMR
jgi:hypothetical protein